MVVRAAAAKGIAAVKTGAQPATRRQEILRWQMLLRQKQEHLRQREMGGTIRLIPERDFEVN